MIIFLHLLTFEGLGALTMHLTIEEINEQVFRQTEPEVGTALFELLWSG